MSALDVIPLLRIAGLRPLLHTMDRLGIPTGRYAERAGIPADVFRYADAFLPHRQVARFIGLAAYGEDMPDLGLIAGASTRFEDLGTFGAPMRGALTVGDALQLGMSLQDAFSSGERWAIHRRDDSVVLERRCLYRLADGEEPADHYGLAIAASLVRRGDGLADWRPRAVCWQSRPSAVVSTSPLFRGAIHRFAQPVTSMAIPLEALSRRLERTPGATIGPDVAAWRSRRPPTDFGAALREVITTLTPPDDRPRIERTAHALGMTVRTLQRQLRNRGLTFERLVQQIRVEAATHLLSHTTSSILDIALDLGYSDHAHFTRAFRGWTGVSPREYRRRSAYTGGHSAPVSLV